MKVCVVGASGRVGRPVRRAVAVVDKVESRARLGARFAVGY